MQQTGFLPHFHSGRIEKSSGRERFHLGRIDGVVLDQLNAAESFAADDAVVAPIWLEKSFT
jgi:hypothetical protein